MAAVDERLAETAVRAEPLAMHSLTLLCLPVALTACSLGSDETNKRDEARDASKASEPAAIRSARQACKHLRESLREREEFDVGISDYEACLGRRANLTHPADPRLCHLARSRVSASGTCILGE
jgi:hypothetical protein